MSDGVVSVLAVFGFVDAMDVIVVVLMEVGGVLFCISKAREFNPT